MPLEIIKTETKKSTPHLALCHEAQGFSANNRPVSLLMKSGVESKLTEFPEEVQKALESLGINKAFYSKIRDSIAEALREAFGEEDEYVWLEDFDETKAIFCKGDGLFVVGYSVQDGKAVVEALATPVDRIVTYNPIDGKLLLSEEAEEGIEDGVYALVAKALKNKETQERLAKRFKSNPEVITLNEEIKKAVAEVETLLKAQIQEKEEALTKALAKVEELEKGAVLKAREEALAFVVDAEKRAELVKSLAALDEEAFATVVKAMAAAAKVEEDSDLFKQTSATMVVKAEKEGAEVQADFDAMMKAKYGVK